MDKFVPFPDHLSLSVTIAQTAADHPESTAEQALEQMAFSVANGGGTSHEIRETVKLLWAAFVFREKYVRG